MTLISENPLSMKMAAARTSIRTVEVVMDIMLGDRCVFVEVAVLSGCCCYKIMMVSMETPLWLLMGVSFLFDDLIKSQ